MGKNCQNCKTVLTKGYFLLREQIFLQHCFKTIVINSALDLGAPVSWQVGCSKRFEVQYLLSLNIIWLNEAEIRSLWSCTFFVVVVELQQTQYEKYKEKINTRKS